MTLTVGHKEVKKTRDGHADIFADTHRCGYPHYPTYVGYSAIYAANISDRHPICIRMAIGHPYSEPLLRICQIQVLSYEIRYLFCSQVYQRCDSRCHRSRPQVHPLCQVQINVGWTGPSFTGILVKTRTLWERVPHVKVPDVQGVNVWLCTL